VRNIKRLNARRKAGQFERFLQLFEHQFHIGLEHAKALFKRELGVLLAEVD